MHSSSRNTDKHRRRPRPAPLHPTNVVYPYPGGLEPPTTSGGTPLQRYLPRQLLVSSPFVASPAADSFGSGPTVFYSPVAATSAAAARGYYYDYYGQQGGLQAPPTPVYMDVSKSSSAPSVYHHDRPSRRLISSLQKATASGEDEDKAANLSKQLAEDAEQDNTDGDADGDADESFSPLDCLSSPSPTWPEEATESTERAIEISHLSATVSAKDILSLIEFGPIESCRVADGTATLVFVGAAVAAQCFNQLQTMTAGLATALDSPEIALHLVAGAELAEPLKTEILRGATRAVCVAPLPKGMSQSRLHAQLEQFGEIETLKYKLSSNAAFVYFTCIENAVKCTQALLAETSEEEDDSAEPSTNSLADLFAKSSINYAADKNNTIGVPSLGLDSYYDDSPNISASSTPVSSPHNSSSPKAFKVTTASGRTQMGHPASVAYAFAPAPALPPQGFPRHGRPSIAAISPLIEQAAAYTFGHPAPGAASTVGSVAGGPASLPDNVGNRTVYLGNLDTSTSEEDICNAVRGGILESIKLLRDRRICFITFIFADDAADFVARAASSGLYVHSKCLKVAWGRPSGPLSAAIEEAVANKASRNLYIGIPKDENGDEQTEVDGVTLEIPDEQTLRRDFSHFGGIEQINFFEDGRCAFVNFFDIAFCMRAVGCFNGDDSEKAHQLYHGRYRPFVISYGKDRCGIPPKKKKKKKKRSKTQSLLGTPSQSSVGTPAPSHASISSSKPDTSPSLATALGDMHIHSESLGAWKRPMVAPPQPKPLPNAEPADLAALSDSSGESVVIEIGDVDGSSKHNTPAPTAAASAPPASLAARAPPLHLHQQQQRTVRPREHKLSRQASRTSSVYDLASFGDDPTDGSQVQYFMNGGFYSPEVGHDAAVLSRHPSAVLLRENVPFTQQRAGAYYVQPQPLYYQMLPPSPQFVDLGGAGRRRAQPRRRAERPASFTTQDSLE